MAKTIKEIIIKLRRETKRRALKLKWKLEKEGIGQTKKHFTTGTN